MTTQETRDDIEAVLVGLVSLDLEIRRSQGGNPGSGIYMLLDLLAGQFLGIPRGSYPVAPITPAAPPVNVDIPSLQPFGPVAIGTMVSCTMGNWEGEPTAYAYDWQAIGDDPSLALGTGPVLPCAGWRRGQHDRVPCHRVERGRRDRCALVE